MTIAISKDITSQAVKPRQSGIAMDLGLIGPQKDMAPFNTLQPSMTLINKCNSLVFHALSRSETHLRNNCSKIKRINSNLTEESL